MIQETSTIIPVMDLMIGQIVLARCGDRESYRPVHSKLVSDASPVAVARALFGQTGCECLYLADLDSFEGASPGWDVYRELLTTGFRLWIDADWLSNEAHLETLQTEFGSTTLRPVFSSETLDDVRQLSVIADLVSDNWDPIFSLDLDGENVLGKSEAVRSIAARELVSAAVEQGARSVIVLNLQSVGSGDGASHLELITQLRSEFERVDLISGGGIRNAQDAEALLAAGCRHVMVASAIHDCSFRPDDVTELNEFRANQPAS